MDGTGRNGGHTARAGRRLRFRPPLPHPHRWPRPADPATARPPVTDDLGLGRVVSDESRQRMLRPDGSLQRPPHRPRRLPLAPPLPRPRRRCRGRPSPVVSALVYAGCAAPLRARLLGPRAGRARRARRPTPAARAFCAALYFSVQTFATIGYGRIAPVSHGAQALVAARGVPRHPLRRPRDRLHVRARSRGPTPTSCSRARCSSRRTGAGGGSCSASPTPAAAS